MKKVCLRRSTAVVVAALFCTANFSVAADSAADEAAIRKAAAEYLNAVQRGDFAAMKSHWTKDGNIIDESGQKTNVADVKPPASGGAADNAAEPQLNVQTDSIRFLTPSVAIEDGTSESGSPANGSPTRGRYSVVWVKRDGKWLIDSLREAAIADASTQNALQSLDWLVGSWVEADDANAFLATFKWSPGNHYLIGEIRITPRDQEPHVVNQRIAWDAAAETIRSWNFDSDGGFSMAVWSRDGNRWVVSASGVLPDGQRTLGRRVFQRIDDQSLLMESLGFQVDGMSVPDLRVKLIRKPASNQ